MIECQMSYSIKCMKRVIEHGDTSVQVKPSVYERYTDIITRQMQSQINLTGWRMWPGNLSSYWKATKHFNEEDYVFN
jgi:hypothetical protein